MLGRTSIRLWVLRVDGKGLDGFCGKRVVHKEYRSGMFYQKLVVLPC